MPTQTDPVADITVWVLTLIGRLRKSQAMFWLISFLFWLNILKMDPVGDVWPLIAIAMAGFSCWLMVRCTLQWWQVRAARRLFESTGELHDWRKL